MNLLPTVMSYDIHGNLSNRDIHGNAMDRNVHGNRPMDVHGNNWDGSDYGGSSNGGRGNSSFGSSHGGGYSGSASNSGGGMGVLFLLAVGATLWGLQQLGVGMGVVNEHLGLEGGWTLAFWIPVSALVARTFPRIVGPLLSWVSGLVAAVAAFLGLLALISDPEMAVAPLVVFGIAAAGFFGGAVLKGWGQARADQRRSNRRSS